MEFFSGRPPGLAIDSRQMTGRARRGPHSTLAIRRSTALRPLVPHPCSGDPLLRDQRFGIDVLYVWTSRDAADPGDEAPASRRRKSARYSHKRRPAGGLSRRTSRWPTQKKNSPEIGSTWSIGRKSSRSSGLNGYPAGVRSFRNSRRLISRVQPAPRAAGESRYDRDLVPLGRQILGQLGARRAGDDRFGREVRRSR